MRAGPEVRMRNGPEVVEWAVDAGELLLAAQGAEAGPQLAALAQKMERMRSSVERLGSRIDGLASSSHALPCRGKTQRPAKHLGVAPGGVLRPPPPPPAERARCRSQATPARALKAGGEVREAPGEARRRPGAFASWCAMRSPGDCSTTTSSDVASTLQKMEARLATLEESAGTPKARLSRPEEGARGDRQPEYYSLDAADPELVEFEERWFYGLDASSPRKKAPPCAPASGAAWAERTGPQSEPHGEPDPQARPAEDAGGGATAAAGAGRPAAATALPAEPQRPAAIARPAGAPGAVGGWGPAAPVPPPPPAEAGPAGGWAVPPPPPPPGSSGGPDGGPAPAPALWSSIPLSRASPRPAAGHDDAGPQASPALPPRAASAAPPSASPSQAASSARRPPPPRRAAAAAAPAEGQQERPHAARWARCQASPEACAQCGMRQEADVCSEAAQGRAGSDESGWYCYPCWLSFFEDNEEEKRVFQSLRLRALKALASSTHGLSQRRHCLRVSAHPEDPLGHPVRSIPQSAGDGREMPDRLKPGSVVQALVRDEGRRELFYELVWGSGPPRGWIAWRDFETEDLQSVLRFWRGAGGPPAEHHQG